MPIETRAIYPEVIWRKHILTSGKATSPTEKAVAALMGTYADNDTGTRVRPPLDRVASEIGCSYNTADRAVQKLRELGFLTLVKRGRPNLYRLSVPKGTPRLKGEGFRPRTGSRPATDVEGLWAAGRADDRTHGAVPTMVEIPAATRDELDWLDATLGPPGDDPF